MFSALHTCWRLVRVPFLLGVGCLAGFGVPYVLRLDHEVTRRFDDLRWQEPSRVYARPLELAVGVPMNAAALRIELDASRYTEDPVAKAPGTWSRSGPRFTISRRGFVSLDGRERPRRFILTLADGRVASLLDADSGVPITRIVIDPARIATLYGDTQEERRVIRLGQAPPLLVTGLQAVEDRDFKHHHGIDPSAIARAALSDLAAGRIVQGGSTLTQQLVRNLFLDRSRTLVRKIDEALLAVLIEAHYDKGRILDAYVNEVFLGQQGGQAVHGFAAASEFYFGRELDRLGPADIALLVGLVQGPSWYDPRRYPDRARARRNLVLAQFRATGLIDDAAFAAARAQPLGVTPAGALPRDRFPAFLDLVRRQLASDYPGNELAAAGLSIHTTLAPSAQILGERAVAQALKGLGKRGDALEAALVVTTARTGEVEAVIGGADPRAAEFNRALDARRPIGSLVKPFVYLVALAHPEQWSLASLVDDTTVDLPQRDGRHWRPSNDDGVTHGKVMLADALAHSYNLATVHLGLALGLDTVKGFLDSFRTGRDIQPNPSLLLGAVDLAPFDVSRLYQYLAADGHALPLRAVRGVLDADGRPLTRYALAEGSGQYRTAARLTTWAMQQVAVSGTAHAITDDGLGALHAAGKTGTSDSQRDSWFAGFTGATLAVAWLGRDDNRPTGLYGATGALQVWINLMRALPTAPLAVPDDGTEEAWVDPATGHRTDPACDGAREMPFAAGHVPGDFDNCPLDRLRALIGDHAAAANPR